MGTVVVGAGDLTYSQRALLCKEHVLPSNMYEPPETTVSKHSVDNIPRRSTIKDRSIPNPCCVVQIPRVLWPSIQASTVWLIGYKVFEKAVSWLEVPI